MSVSGQGDVFLKRNVNLELSVVNHDLRRNGDNVQRNRVVNRVVCRHRKSVSCDKILLFEYKLNVFVFVRIGVQKLNGNGFSV